MTIKALSWRQPYADLMLMGKIETRTWPTNYRGWVLICSSKRPYFLDQVINISGSEHLLRIFDQMEAYNRFTQKDGYAIGIGRLIDCRPMTKEDEDACYVNYFPGLYCHVYSDVQPLRSPFPWKGSQGWRTVDQKTKELITQML
ncbi:MAG: hypothetical protein KGZ82_04375 [Bacteroidales bacterium]|nr:hypothetical protein [Bacteroidales bacterium]